jgi:hypothetical protein
MTLEYLLDPMEEILPGQWRLSFPDAVNEYLEQVGINSKLPAPLMLRW